jgi:hypothetical protein
MFVEARSVESRERVTVGWKMPRDPVNEDPDSSLMQMINKVLEVVG